jgi:hypothetical protein
MINVFESYLTIAPRSFSSMLSTEVFALSAVALPNPDISRKHAGRRILVHQTNYKKTYGKE